MTLLTSISFLPQTGNTLLPSTGFAAMTIFKCLRFPLSEFPEIAGLYIQSKISLRRIEHFLRNEDIRGLNGKNNLNGDSVTAGWIYCIALCCVVLI